MRNVDADLFVALLIVCPLGVYKTFYEKGSLLSTGYGFFLLGITIFLSIILIKKLKSRNKEY
jgi:hypothetical protein